MADLTAAQEDALLADVGDYLEVTTEYDSDQSLGTVAEISGNKAPATETQGPVGHEAIVTDPIPFGAAAPKKHEQSGQYTSPSGGSTLPR